MSGIGEYHQDTNATSTTCTAGNYGISYKSLSKGVWAVHAMIHMYANASGGVYALMISKGDGATGDEGKTTMYIPNASASYAIEANAIIEVTGASQTIGIHSYGSNQYNRFKFVLSYVRIK